MDTRGKKCYWTSLWTTCVDSFSDIGVKTPLKDHKHENYMNVCIIAILFLNMIIIITFIWGLPLSSNEYI